MHKSDGAFTLQRLSLVLGAQHGQMKANSHHVFYFVPVIWNRRRGSPFVDQLHHDSLVNFMDFGGGVSKVEGARINTLKSCIISTY